MILSLLAALFGAAQEAIVVYEGATTNHFVENHPGSNYNWGVYSDFSPDINAPPNDYLLLSSNDANTVQIRWLNKGMYYLKVTETDISGCNNVKVLPVNVISNIRSVGFLTKASRACFDRNGNGFELPLIVKGDNEGSLAAEYYPITIDFLLNDKGFSQQVLFDNQVIRISEDWINPEEQTNFSLKLEITACRDVQNVQILPDLNMKVHDRVIMALPQIEFEKQSSTVEQGLILTHMVNMLAGKPENSVYNWSLDPGIGSTTDLNSIRESSANILWNGPP